MSQQHTKSEKRARRKRYLARVRERINDMDRAEAETMSATSDTEAPKASWMKRLKKKVGLL